VAPKRRSRLDGHPDLTSLLVVGVLVTVTVLIVVGAIRNWSYRPPAASGSQTSSSSSRAASPAPGASAATSDDQQALEAARGVTTAFLETYSSYRWDDPPQQAQQRLRPYDTDRFDAAMGRSSGASALLAERAKRHEVSVGHLMDLALVSRPSEGTLSVNGTVRQDLTSDQGTSSQLKSVQVTLIDTSTGWRVDDVTE